MADVDAELDRAGLHNPHVREHVRYWAELTQPDRIEVVDVTDDARLIQESLDAGEIVPAGEGLYYSRSHPKDTARSEERTIVATSDAGDRGEYNNWHDAEGDAREARARHGAAHRRARRCTSSRT